MMQILNDIFHILSQKTRLFANDFKNRQIIYLWKIFFVMSTNLCSLPRSSSPINSDLRWTTWIASWGVTKKLARWLAIGHRLVEQLKPSQSEVESKRSNRWITGNHPKSFGTFAITLSFPAIHCETPDRTISVAPILHEPACGGRRPVENGERLGLRRKGKEEGGCSGEDRESEPAWHMALSHWAV